MVKTRRSVVPFVGVLLMFACVMQGNLLTSYAQSTSSADHNAYFIQGAVNKPGVYRIESAPSLLKLLTLAGGLADSHGGLYYSPASGTGSRSRSRFQDHSDTDR